MSHLVVRLVHPHVPQTITQLALRSLERSSRELAPTTHLAHLAHVRAASAALRRWRRCHARRHRRTYMLLRASRRRARDDDTPILRSAHR